MQKIIYLDIMGALEMGNQKDSRQKRKPKPPANRFYNRVVKRALDIVLSFLGLILLSWVFVIVILVVFIDDPGSPFFSQDRIGKNKKHFALYKFRSMKKSTPHDVPTHMLENPDQYLLRSGKIIRKLSLDELPQMWNILKGDMSVVGPRPALWNQEDLIAERDKYDANSVRPGLTGWAQINGRDELEIPVKAKLDGEYVERLSFGFDCKCFFGSIGAVLSHKGFVEGVSKDPTEK